MTLILNGKWINLSQMKVLIGQKWPKTGRKWPKTAIYSSRKKTPMIMMMDLAQHGLKRVKCAPKMGEMRTKNG